MPRRCDLSSLTYLEGIRDAMRDEMRLDDRVLVIGQDVGRKGGVFKATEGLLDEFGESRVIDAPIAESLIVGFAIGAAMNGLRPIAEIQFQDFIFPAVDQIISEAAKIRYRSNNDFSAPIVVRAPFGSGVRGALYHSQSIEAIFCHIPGLKVVVPSTPFDAKGLLRAAIRDPDPVLFFEHKRLYRSVRGEVPREDFTVPLGRASLVRDGVDIAVFSYGLMTHVCLQAAEAAARLGCQCAVVDLRSLRPLDREMITATTRRCGRVLIVQEATLPMSVASEVAAIVAEDCFGDLDAPVTRIGQPDVPATPFASQLEQFLLVTPEVVAEQMLRLAAY